jgi:hypothetical protein
LAIMRRGRPIALVMSLSLALVACGGDDGGDALDLSGPADVAADAAPGDETDAETGAAPVVPTLPDGISDAVDEALESGDFGELEEMARSFNTGEGGGSITIGDVTYTVVSDICIVQLPNVTVEGPATGSDGSVAWVSVDRSITTRDELAEFVDESTLELLFPDGAEEMEDVLVSVEVGRTELFGSGAEDQPSWESSIGSFGSGELEFEATANGLRGQGTAADFNGIGAPFGETVPMEFEVGCN